MDFPWEIPSSQVFCGLHQWLQFLLQLFYIEPVRLVLNYPFHLIMVIKMRPKPIKKKQKNSCPSISPYSVGVIMIVSALLLLAVTIALAALMAMSFMCSLLADVQYFRSGLTNCTANQRKTQDLLSKELSFTKTCFNTFKAERAKNIEYEEEISLKDSEISNLKKEMEKIQNITDRLEVELKIERLQFGKDRQEYQRKLEQLTEINNQCNDKLRTCQHDLENPPWDWKTATAACGVCSAISAFIPGGSTAVNFAMKLVKLA